MLVIFSQLLYSNTFSQYIEVYHSFIHSIHSFVHGRGPECVTELNNEQQGSTDM